MFEAFYASCWQHPLLLWAAGLLGLGYVLARGVTVHESVRRYALAAVAVALLDAWLTTSEVPLVGPLQGVWATLIPVLFVIVGDLRYLALTEGMQADGSLRWSARALLVALAWSLLVPVGAQLVVRLLLQNDSPRVLFLTYELLFFALIVARIPYTRARLADATTRRWQRRVDNIALAWYGTWISADILILFLETDLGYLARVVPNALYYGAFPAVLVASAPQVEDTL